MSNELDILKKYFFELKLNVNTVLNEYYLLNFRHKYLNHNSVIILLFSFENA